MAFLRPTRNPNPFTQPFSFGQSNYNYATAVQGIANLLAYWPLTETSGTIVNDFSGNGYNGSYINGPTLASRAFSGASMGSAPSFNGTNQYANVFGSALASAINFNACTVGLWVWHTSSAISQSALNANYVIGEVSGGVDFEARNTTWYMQFTNNAVSYAPGITTPITNGAWVHLAVTRSQVANQVIFYVNGTSVGSAAAPTVSQTLGAFYLARRDDAGDIRYWADSLGQVVVYTRALTSSEITTLATAF